MVLFRLSAILLIVGFQIIMMGIMAELIAINRQLLEDIQVRIKKNDLSQDSLSEPSPKR